ncbi:GNAT family N-acetyltransferase [Sporosalibacterium faouarense]|uniref:GNAT family N-acetyltransferase n=1 Tax=Sporosalibacterium faouarense TaxID=516123 RepID=UPI00192C6DE5|nr:GNAT family N-acetyltransferase [Sporosalibacterium faouarense]
MEDIKIIEYDHSYAEEVAHMWAMSGEHWGGSNTIPTKESIIEEHESSDNLNTYIALCGDEIVGYCSFSEYKQDQGAMYIPLLNVRPDYHGKKIGKKLVLKAVERTVELGWPRLDLYTWPGNTKAVPLYKKCGFFWEKRDDSTHLMNFIPTVLTTEAVKDYFQDIDWYVDSKRRIEIKPDGDEKKDFGNYEYIWDKDGKSLRIEFERRSRGLRLIETDDYLIEVKLKDQKLIFANEYEVTYHIVNKTRKPLHIKIDGLKDRNISFNMNKEVKVESEEFITGTFYVEKVDEEQNHRRTHPAVAAEVSINGKKAMFKMGVDTQFPCKIDMISPDVEKHLGTENKCYLQIESNYNTDATFEFNLPQSQDIKLLKRSIKVELKPKERKTISIPYIFNRPAMYSEKIDIKVNTKNKLSNFSKNLSAIFKGRLNKFGGETKDNWIICNGKHTVFLSKFDNSIEVKTFRKSIFETFIMYPKLGLPYSAEFSKKRPYEVKYFQQEDDIILKAFYKSSDFENVELISILTLSSNGILRYNHEVQNIAESPTKHDIKVNINFYHSLADSYIPYGDRIVYIDDAHYMDTDYWDSNKINENWIFSKREDLNRGICWSKDNNIKSNGWCMAINSNLGIIEGKGSRTTEPICVALDAFNDWKEFRRFALKENKPKENRVVDKFEVIVNGNNPFIKGDLNVDFKYNCRVDFDGQIKLSSNNKAFNTVTKEFIRDNGIRQSNVELPNTFMHPINVLNLSVDFEDIAFNRELTIFNVGKEEVIQKQIKDEGKDSYIIDNGLIKMKACPEFSNSIYSLKYKDIEWLDTSFPVAEPKSWWNPWTGGMLSRPADMKMISVLGEERKCEFVELEDNFNNLWQGIKVSMNIDKHERFKGLKLNQYYLTLPQLPLLLTFTEVHQNTGTYFDSVKFYTDLFIKSNDKLNENWIITKNSQGDFMKHKGGTSCDICDKHLLAHGSIDLKDQLMIYHTGDKPIEGFIDNLVLGTTIKNFISCESGEKAITKPTFIFLNEEYLEEKKLKTLNNIRFEI